MTRKEKVKNILQLYADSPRKEIDITRSLGAIEGIYAKEFEKALYDYQLDLENMSGISLPCFDDWVKEVLEYMGVK